MQAGLRVADLAGVVYSAGKVFDGLSTGRLDTERFLRSGSTAGVSSRSDLALLEDLRDVSQFVIEHQRDRIDPAYVRAVNATLTRSAAIDPGRYRTAADGIGVDTPLGRHEPPGMTDARLQGLVAGALAEPTPREQALSLFVGLARAQPFMDGNKRTALFVANSVLIRQPHPMLLTVPTDPEPAREFIDLLAWAYVENDDSGVKALLRERGFASLPDPWVAADVAREVRTQLEAGNARGPGASFRGQLNKLGQGFGPGI